jgi:hypothetical protein
LDHARRVVGRRGESGELELVEMDGIKDVPSILKKKRRVKIEGGVLVCGYTLIVSSQLNVARAMRKTSAHVPHKVRGSRFCILGEGFW